MTDILKKLCPVCGIEAIYSVDYDRNRVFFGCPVCGSYELGAYDSSKLNYNYLLSYLVYHRLKYNEFEYRYHTTLDKEACDQ